MPRNAFVVFVLLMFLSGCTAEEEQLIDEGGVEAPVATAFPSWSATAHDASEMNGTMLDNESYVAYFSAPWCAHCETTLDAYDQVLPEGKMMVFSYDGREDYSDMDAWHNKTESNLNRTVDRPFMLHPSLAQEVELSNIPYVLFVNEQGYIYHIQVGRITDIEAISTLWEATQTATTDDEGRWL
jgi:thiol-disulfide isomerase/thioredoxin